MFYVTSTISYFFDIRPSFLTILAVSSIILYLLTSFSLLSMAKYQNADYPWIAWIPFVRFYLLGELLSERVSIFNRVIPYAQVLLPAVSLLFLGFSSIPFVGWVMMILCIIYHFAAYYRLYRLYCPQYALFFLVLSILFCSLSEPFILFFLRKHPLREYLTT